MLCIRTIKVKQAPDKMCVYATSFLGAGRDEALCRTAKASEPWPSLNISAPLWSPKRHKSISDKHKNQEYYMSCRFIWWRSSSWSYRLKKHLSYFWYTDGKHEYFWPWAINVQIASSSKRCFGSITISGVAEDFPQSFFLCSFPSPIASVSLRVNNSFCPRAQNSFN